MLDIRKIKTKIFEGIEKYVKDKQCSYIEAVILFCENNDIDLEQAASIIQSDELMVSKLKMEAEDLNFLKKSARLPI